MKNLPNILTLSRIVLAVFFVMAISQYTASSTILATLIFLAAALTDYYDGYFAKKQSGISNFGKIMDPIADKFLILSAFFIFAQLRLIDQWMFAVILAREVGITALRIFAMSRGKFLAAERAGKIKTVVQMISIFLVLITLILKTTDLISAWPSKLILIWSSVVVLSLWAAVILTVTSGLLYICHNRKNLSRLPIAPQASARGWESGGIPPREGQV